MSTRPRIIMHMETSLNSKSTGPFMRTREAAVASQLYNETHLSFNAGAWLCGRVTMQAFAGSGAPVVDPLAPPQPREDHRASFHARDFVAVVDPGGNLAWTSNSVTFSIRPPAHIIEILTARASDDYVATLHQQEISYIFAGRADRPEELDLELAVTKLREIFGISTLVVSGGARINGSFLNAGLVDEISLIVSPVLDDALGTPSFTERDPGFAELGATPLALRSVEQLDGDVSWLRYELRR